MTKATDSQPLFGRSQVAKHGDDVAQCPSCGGENLRLDEDGKYCADCVAPVPVEVAPGVFA